MNGRRAALPVMLDPDYAALKRAIIARTGHHYYDDKDGLLVERLRNRFAAAGCLGFAAYRARLDDPRSGPGEWAALVSEITIGETFFFRYAEQFATLRATILPDILARNRDRRRIRVWSAGCSNGAEAYSLAILIHEALGDALADWSVSILGTDIDEAVLASARQAEFGNWSLRSLGPEERARWFVPGSRPGLHALARRYAGMVRFEPHNLLTLADDTAPLQFSDFDLVLCRNVLIYFHPEAVAAVVAGLGRTLAPDGWLLLGHAESLPAFTGSLATADLPGVLAYRPKPAAAAAPAEPMPPLAPPLPVGAAAGDAAVRGLRRRATVAPRPMRPATIAPTAGPATADDPTRHEAARLETVRRLADAGDLAGALAACRAAGAAGPAGAAVHYYEGLIRRALDGPAAAGAAFRKAVYLDRDFVLGHYHLGLTLIDGGEAEAGRRAIAHAARLVADLPGDTRLPEGGGLTAADLASLARLLVMPGGMRP